MQAPEQQGRQVSAVEDGLTGGERERSKRGKDDKTAKPARWNSEGWIASTTRPRRTIDSDRGYMLHLLR